MSLKRIKIRGCTAGSIIVSFYIEDNVDELRNSKIQIIIDQIIIEQNLIVYLNKNIFPMFDPNQTTPKPPTPTIPPIGEVTVDWLPIGIAIAVIGCFFFSKYLPFLFNISIVFKVTKLEIFKNYWYIIIHFVGVGVASFVGVVFGAVVVLGVVVVVVVAAGVGVVVVVTYDYILFISQLCILIS